MFLSPDPAVVETLQPYSYAADDSINGADPSGLCKAGSVSFPSWLGGSGNCSDAAGGVAHTAAAQARQITLLKAPLKKSDALDPG